MSEPLDQLVSLVAANHPAQELALGWLRYEVIRNMNPRDFAALWKRNLSGETFDDLVTEAMLSWKAGNI